MKACLVRLLVGVAVGVGLCAAPASHAPQAKATKPVCNPAKDSTWQVACHNWFLTHTEEKERP